MVDVLVKKIQTKKYDVPVVMIIQLVQLFFLIFIDPYNTSGGSIAATRVLVSKRVYHCLIPLDVQKVVFALDAQTNLNMEHDVLLMLLSGVVCSVFGMLFLSCTYSAVTVYYFRGEAESCYPN
jgi:hypothetical protein